MRTSTRVVRKRTAIRQTRFSTVTVSTPESSPKPPEDKEYIADGLAAIKVYEGKIGEINLPEIYRRLKEKFNRDKK